MCSLKLRAPHPPADTPCAEVDLLHPGWRAFLCSVAPDVNDEATAGLMVVSPAAVGQFAYTSIDPPSWCLSTDESFGVMGISVSDSTYDSASSSTFSNFSSSYYNSSSQSDSGGVGIVYGPFSATADVGYSTASANGGFSTGASGATNWDRLSNASITGEFFLA